MLAAWVKRNGLNIAAFAWGLAEATAFFIVPDVILSFIGLERGAKAALAACLYAAAGAGLGGALMFAWSASNLAAASAFVRGVPAISDTMMAHAYVSMLDQGWLTATFLGPLSGTPYKIYAVFAPHVGADLATFAAASVLLRLPRFLIVSLGVTLIGRLLSRWLSPRALLVVLVGAWVVFYAVFFALTPG